MEPYSKLWKTDVQTTVSEFMASKPQMYDFQMVFEDLDKYGHKLEEEPSYYVVGALFISTEDFKTYIRSNINQLKQVTSQTLAFTKVFIEQNIMPIENLASQIDEWERNLSRHINHLDDIAAVMETLRQIREVEIDVDRELMSCEDASSLLSKYDVVFPKDISDRVELVRCAFIRAKERVVTVLDYILSVQQSYKEGLFNSIKSLHEQAGIFEAEYLEVSL
ncbi:unnamed protein product [Protopolystoma xenopodis]|uniref:Dynein heavy chain tail domain-containing protein n=1 Tax=Protopolystoma xenopodis TaxID=117903 RepID=A0A3S5BV56_9PLAT|nr:unnamed protein product [Protopolystoma xenopodis]